MEISLRFAKKEDLGCVLQLIQELAAYERAPDEVSVTLQDLEKDGFGEKPVFEIILAEAEGKVVGMALYFFAYSTWKGKCMYLEDIIVTEPMRGKGIGGKLFDAVVARCRQENARRLMWQVLEWNEPAINFYKKYHAVLDPTWVNGKLTEEQIRALIPGTGEILVGGGKD